MSCTLIAMSHHKATTTHYLTTTRPSFSTVFVDGDKLAGHSFRASGSSSSVDRAFDDSPRLRGYAPLAL